MKKLYIVLAAAAMVTLPSCSDFLEPDPKGQMLTETFFKTKNDLDMAVNALYYTVQYSQTNSNPTIPQVQGDDITSGIGSNKGAYLSADAFEEPSDYKGVKDLWSTQYSIIQAANLIVDNADKAKGNATDREIDIAKGNALFWRGVAYFQLVRVFGPLPVNLHNVADDNKTPLTDESGIYKLIVADLEAADQLNLPTTYKGEKYGFTEKCNYWVTAQAVKAALTAVYMNLAGYPLKRTEYYEKAADMAKSIVDGVAAGTYDLALESDWREVYSPGNDWSKEQLMTISYYDSPGTMGEMGKYTSQFCKCHRFETLNNGWGDFLPEYKWWATFPDGPRKDAVYDPRINTYKKDAETGNTIYVSWWAQSQNPDNPDEVENNMSPYKPMFAPFTINADENGAPIREPHDWRKPAYDGQSFPQNHRFIRYSEVLCWYAEAAARSGKHMAEAAQALQPVLDRAYAAGTAPAAASLSADELAELAYMEHGFEVTGYPLALVTRRADQFRMDRLREAWEYRNGPQTDVIVPKGTKTYGFGYRVIIKPNGKPQYLKGAWEAEQPADVVVREPNPVAATWNGVHSIYQPYPPTETEKNPNIVRK